MQLRALLAALAAVHGTAHAQQVVRLDESLGPTRPEAWAMSYVAASTFLTSFGATAPLEPWQATVAVDLGHVPRLSDEQQRVGFTGTKQEDLNRSPVFGRVRLLFGLPAEFVGEIAYTPPIEVRDTRARNLFALAIARRIALHERASLSLRAFAQRGSASGDITCPSRLAGAPAAENPFGCQEASRDRIELDYYGADVTAAWHAGPWQAYGSAGVARTDLAVQVDALTGGVRDLSRLTAKASRPFYTVGARWDLDRCWSLAAEVLHVPLRVDREAGRGGESDPYTGLRLQAAYRFR